MSNHQSQSKAVFSVVQSKVHKILVMNECFFICMHEKVSRHSMIGTCILNGRILVVAGAVVIFCVCWFFCLFTFLFFYLFVYFFICLFICLFVSDDVLQPKDA